VSSTEAGRSLLGARRPVLDIALGVGTAVLVLVAGASGIGPVGPRGPLGAGAVLLACGVGAALAARRTAPFVVLLVSNAAVAAWFVLAYPGRLVTVAALVACYTVAAERGPRWGAAGWLVTAAVSTVTVRAVLAPVWFDDRAVNALSLTLAAAALGAVTHARRAQAAGLRERTERIAEARAEQARRAAAEQRLEIARELHDVFGHTMATVSVQAGVAAHVLDRRPELAEQAVRTIKTISDEGLAEVQVLLAALRSEDAAPARGLAELETLLDVTRSTGVPVRLDVTGEPRPLPARVEMAVFRIVQESLTNARRHAHPRTVRVRLCYGADAVGVEVRNDGVADGDAPAPAGGHGLAGMRARASALGGTLTAGRTAGGGFAVECSLPTGDRSGT
jgi:signal transduction histidine kinase